VQVRVFDPEMCCTTGICGPAPDPALIEFNSALERLRSEGADVQRYQLSRNPRSFVGNPEVYRLLLQQGPAALPVTVVDGTVVAVGRYPSYEQMRAPRPVAAAAAAGRPAAGGGCG
jgi:hypothetical protein